MKHRESSQFVSQSVAGSNRGGIMRSHRNLLWHCLFGSAPIPALPPTRHYIPKGRLRQKPLCASLSGVNRKYNVAAIADDDEYNDIAHRLTDQRGIPYRQTVTHTDYRPISGKSTSPYHYRRAVCYSDRCSPRQSQHQYPHGS